MSESKADLTKLRVVDLKQRLSELSLPTAGLKAELVARLHEHLSTSNEKDAAGEKREFNEGGEDGQHEREQQKEMYVSSSSSDDVARPAESPPHAGRGTAHHDQQDQGVVMSEKSDTLAPVGSSSKTVEQLELKSPQQPIQQLLQSPPRQPPQPLPPPMLQSPQQPQQHLQAQQQHLHQPPQQPLHQPQQQLQAPQQHLQQPQQQLHQLPQQQLQAPQQPLHQPPQQPPIQQSTISVVSIIGDGTAAPPPPLSRPATGGPTQANAVGSLLLGTTVGAATCPTSAQMQMIPPPPLLAAMPPTSSIASVPSVLEEALMQQKVRQQQQLLEQQKNTQKHEDLLRLQQQAMLEKQKEESEKQARLLSLQQEALKQNENEQKQLQALRLKPKPSEATSATSVTASDDDDDDDSTPSKGNSSGAGLGSILAALQQRQQPLPTAQSATAAPNMQKGPGFMGPPRPLGPPMGSSPMRPPLGMPPRPPHGTNMNPMGQGPTQQERPPMDNSGMARDGPGRDMRNMRPMGTSSSGPRQNNYRYQGGGRGGDGRPPALMSLHVAGPRDDGKEVRLPQALEEALAYKHERAKQVGVTLEEEHDERDEQDDEYEHGSDEEEQDGHDADDSLEFNEWMPASADMDWAPAPQPRADLGNKQQNDDVEDEQEEEEEEEADDEEDEINKDQEIIATKSSKKDKSKKKKKKKKKRKGKPDGCKRWIHKQLEEERRKKEEILSKKNKPVEPKVDVDVSYVQEEIVLDYSDPMHRHFAKVFENFKITEPVTTPEEVKVEEKHESSVVAMPNGMDLKKVPKLAEEVEDDSDDEDSDGKPKISKRKMKLLRRMSIAELKQTVNRPDVVEMHDVTARDPKLLVHLKATRNTVPVPRHWCFKRKYLQGKRGIEKPPFELPDFIKRTGIMEMRAALQEKEDQKTLKAKMRDKVRPKMGKIDIDYQKLHDAFFKWQCKPEMTVHGDLYYEGKEFETKMKDKKPGEMSDDLRIALGMPVGANAHKVPPPWLIAMQRYGPPPSYPNLKIPGLNAPIPEGCSFGYHAGGWGKPPVDNMGKPIYGDVFGTQSKENEVPMIEEEVEKSLWGELESESEEESEEEESSEEEEDASGLVTPGETGLVTPSGISSLPAGLETPDMIELRKKHPEAELEGGDTPAALYTILPEKRMEGMGRGMMASTHTYDMSAAAASGRAANQAVEVALDPSELDLVDTDAMAARYEATIREQHAGEDEDFSDMVAEHAAKQRNKRRRLQHQEQNKPAKKYKDFKF